MNVLIRIKNIIVLLLSFFFLMFGIHLLAGSFKMKNPLEFVMTLFSASFIILFCIVGILYAFFRLFPEKLTMRGIMLTRNKVLLPLALIILLQICGLAHAIDLEKKIIKNKLDNGLTVLMMERKFSPTVSSLSAIAWAPLTKQKDRPVPHIFLST